MRDRTWSNWHHAPMHSFEEAGSYFITAATLHKEHFFRSRERLTLLTDELLAQAEEHGWQLQAWAVFSNHYHFVGYCEKPQNLSQFVRAVHSKTARAVNALDETQGRPVWYQYRDTALTIESSYYARLKYVHYNPVKHHVANVSTLYPWCSAAWFAAKADPELIKKLRSFGMSQVKVHDDYDPIVEDW